MSKTSEKEALLFVNHMTRPDSDFATLSHRDAKKQKNFFYSGAGDFATARLSGTDGATKSFLVLFFKKEPLPLNLNALAL
jgi:hypothetical protein